MSWVLVILGGLFVVVLLKVLFKAVKVALLLSLLSLFIIVMWLWHRGLILR